MPLTRRSFLGAALAAPALGALATRADDAKPTRKIKIGFIGCGGRGLWIAGLFLKHGGYTKHYIAKKDANLILGHKLRFSLEKRQPILWVDVDLPEVRNGDR